MTLVVGSLGLYWSISTQSQPTDLAKAAEVHTIRSYYDKGVIERVG